jgi:mRNA capping enzyme, catalytic domain/mRNA capping enzyme, beta chain/mRNA capping enzyme, C-terminal domain
MKTADIQAKKRKLEEQVSANAAAASTPVNHGIGKYLTTPIHSPTRTMQMFLSQVRTDALQYLPEEIRKLPITSKYFELECRLGVLKVPNSNPGRRVASSGAKQAPDGSGVVIPAFDCTNSGAQMVSGVSRSHFIKWTAGGNAEMNPIALALGCRPDADSATVKREVIETERVETVYSGYSNSGRLVYNGLHPPPANSRPAPGVMETKKKLKIFDLTVPAAPYDVRVTLSSEKTLSSNSEFLPGWDSRRVKRRRSYSRKSIAWQIDVTEVTTTTNRAGASESVDYEIEMELRESVLLQLINEENMDKIKAMAGDLASQFWWIVSQLNPSKDVLDVEETLQPHPNTEACALALSQCAAMRSFMSHFSGRSSTGPAPTFNSPIGRQGHASSGADVSFPGCMPVNFSRHNLDEIQRLSDNSYYLSEKTDGVRHFLIFTGLNTAVLVDRAMRCKRPKPNSDQEPFAHLMGKIKPGTVFDGEVVMNRSSRKPRPIFIVFDVMTISVHEPVLHLPFEQRLRHLREATFAVDSHAPSVFEPSLIRDMSLPLPLILKNFVKRTDVDNLLSFVGEERGMRCYHNGDAHYHPTDGIIFQPNRPYVCGTDVHLLKWKYLDTVTIDVDLMAGYRRGDNFEDDANGEEKLCTAVMGPENTDVDMTRYIILPQSERLRMEADRHESRDGRIAEVGFDPETGEWYYVTMRSDKVTPNHINTVLGTLLELAEGVTTDELRYRMSIPSGMRDTYRKDMRGMLKQLLDHQRKRLKSGPSTSH